MKKEMLLTFSEVAAVGATLLLLPCALAHLALGCELTDIVAQLSVVAVGVSAILTGLAIHEGWYLDHLGRFGQTPKAEADNDEAAQREPIVRRHRATEDSGNKPDL
jgi:hypothetical protein